jgi:hypothetical protein
MICINFSRIFGFYEDDDTPCPGTGRKMQNNVKKSVLLLDIYREPLYNDAHKSILDKSKIVITGREPC